MMKLTTERKYHSWLNGAVQTTCPSMWVRQRRLWWTTGETYHPPLTIDTSTVERVSSTKFLGVHIKEDSPGPPTLHHSPRRRNSAYTFSAHPHHFQQGNHWERADQLYHCLVLELWCRRPQDPLAESDNSCKDRRAPLPSILDIFLARCSIKATSIMKDPTHPSHSLFLKHGPTWTTLPHHWKKLSSSFATWQQLTFEFEWQAICQIITLYTVALSWSDCFYYSPHLYVTLDKSVCKIIKCKCKCNCKCECICRFVQQIYQTENDKIWNLRLCYISEITSSVLFNWVGGILCEGSIVSTYSAIFAEM